MTDEKKSRVCLFCYRDYHNTKDCPLFVSYKKACTTTSYLGNKLFNNDRQGFCAAGVLLFNRQDKTILMIKEARQGKVKYNLPGGKRDYRKESPNQVAIREVMEELPFELDTKVIKYLHEGNRKIYWSGASKYVCFIYRVDQDMAKLIKGEWINYNKVKNDVHNYIRDMVEDIDKLDALFTAI